MNQCCRQTCTKKYNDKAEIFMSILSHCPPTKGVVRSFSHLLTCFLKLAHSFGSLAAAAAAEDEPAEPGWLWWLLLLPLLMVRTLLS